MNWKACWVAGWLLVAVGCGDDTTSGGEAGGGAMSQAGSGGAGGAAGAGTGGADAMGGSGGTTTGGSGGNTMAGAGGTGSLVPADIDLGGLNADLPDPDHECSVMDYRSTGCITVSGEYNGEPFGVGGAAKLTLYMGERGSVIIGTMADADEFQVVTVLGGDAPVAEPVMFDHGFPPWGEQGNLVAFRRESRLVDSYNRDTLLHTDTHDQEARLVGEFWAASDGGSGPLREMVTAAFAWSMTPKSDCAPDADGLGCDSIRMRGYFHGPTLGLVQ